MAQCLGCNSIMLSSTKGDYCHVCRNANKVEQDIAERNAPMVIKRLTPVNPEALRAQHRDGMPPLNFGSRRAEIHTGIAPSTEKCIRASEMRNNPTPGELAALRVLLCFAKAGEHFFHQAIVHGYIVDFLFDHYRVVVEVDGLIHQDEQKFREDLIRQRNLERIGYRFVRVTNGDVLSDPLILHRLVEAAIGVKVDYTTRVSLPQQLYHLEQKRSEKRESIIMASGEKRPKRVYRKRRKKGRIDRVQDLWPGIGR